MSQINQQGLPTPGTAAAVIAAPVSPRVRAGRKRTRIADQPVPLLATAQPVPSTPAQPTQCRKHSAAASEHGG